MVDVAKIDGEIGRIMPGLGVGDVDAVEQHRNLVVGAAADADVGLHAHGAALPDVHAQGIFEQVVDVVGRGGGDRQAVDQRDGPRILVKRDGKLRSGDRNTVQHIVCLCLHRRGGEDRKKQRRNVSFRHAQY